MSEDIMKILRMFCADPNESGNRDFLLNPFTKDGYTWATNGHFMVRVAEIENTGCPEKAPNIKSTFDQSFSLDGLRPLKDGAKGIVEKEETCSNCDGSGYQHDCPTCTCTCESCYGSGSETEKTSVTIGEAFFRAKYIKILSTLPNIMIQDEPHKTEPMSFTFDGGCGLLMPCRDKYFSHLEVEL